MMRLTTFLLAAICVSAFTNIHARENGTQSETWDAKLNREVAEAREAYRQSQKRATVPDRQLKQAIKALESTKSYCNENKTQCRELIQEKTLKLEMRLVDKVLAGKKRADALIAKGEHILRAIKEARRGKAREARGRRDRAPATMDPRHEEKVKAMVQSLKETLDGANHSRVSKRSDRIALTHAQNSLQMVLKTIEDKKQDARVFNHDDTLTLLESAALRSIVFGQSQKALYAQEARRVENRLRAGQITDVDGGINKALKQETKQLRKTTRQFEEDLKTIREGQSIEDNRYADDDTYIDEEHSVN